MTKAEVVASVGQARYRKASGILHGKISGADSVLPHVVAPMVWDAPLSRTEQVRLFFSLYDDLPSYGMLMYATMAYPEFDEPAREVWWQECLARLSNADDVLRKPILYACWCDYFEDPDLVADVWRRVTAGDDPRIIEAVLHVSGPVPWSLKASLYNSAAMDTSRHRALLHGLLGSAFDVYGDIEPEPARELLARLQVATDEPGYRELCERLNGNSQPSSGSPPDGGSAPDAAAPERQHVGRGLTMAEDWVVYRGVRMTRDWPERIRLAQLETTCRPNGIEMPRVRYGEELEDWGANRGACHDCGVIEREFHVPGCDVERCPVCGGQVGVCECDWPDLDDSEA